MPILVLPGTISSLRCHFPNVELQQKSNAIAQVPKSMGCSNLLTISPSLAFNTHFLAPTPLWTTFRKVKYFHWANTMITEKTSHQAFWPPVYKNVWFFSPPYFYIQEWPPFLKSSIGFPNRVFWHPQPQPPRDLFLLFINSTLISSNIVCTTLNYQCDVTSSSFIWPYVSWFTKAWINSHPFPLEKYTSHVMFSSFYACRNRGNITGSWSQEQRQN